MSHPITIPPPPPRTCIPPPSSDEAMRTSLVPIPAPMGAVESTWFIQSTKSTVPPPRKRKAHAD